MKKQKMLLNSTILHKFPHCVSFSRYFLITAILFYSMFHSKSHFDFIIIHKKMKMRILQLECKMWVSVWCEKFFSPHFKPWQLFWKLFFHIFADVVIKKKFFILYNSSLFFWRVNFVNKLSLDWVSRVCVALENGWEKFHLLQIVVIILFYPYCCCPMLQLEKWMREKYFKNDKLLRDGLEIFYCAYFLFSCDEWRISFSFWQQKNGKSFFGMETIYYVRTF
jgi:hypothetical protein